MNKKRILILTYYWPPSGGGGVQRWMYFAIYLKRLGWNPTIITVHPNKASYPLLDTTQLEMVNGIDCIYTSTCEPLKLYSYLKSGKSNEAIPYGNLGETSGSVFTKIMAFIRANIFVPDARLGWMPFAKKAAANELKSKKYEWLVTTGPPHSTHLAGLSLSKKFDIKWLADMRDPWTEIYFLQNSFRFNFIKQLDRRLESRVLNTATLVTTVGPSMANLIRVKMKTPQNLHVLYNGFDHEMFENLETKKSKNEKFSISHVGLLGQSQRFDVFIDALKNSSINLSKIKIHLAGLIHPLHLDKARTDLPQVELSHEEFLPRKLALELMNSSDLLLLCPPMVGQTQLIVSTKTMEYLACGIPILGIGDTKSDAASLIKQANNSSFNAPDGQTEITQFMEDAFKNWETNSVQTSLFDPSIYSRFAVAKSLAALLNSQKYAFGHCLFCNTKNQVSSRIHKFPLILEHKL